MKKLFNFMKISLMTLVVICLMMTVSWAALEGGNAKKGKILAKEKCKYCHVAGADGGTMTPLSKTQRQWERFYKKDKHNKLAPGTWDNISEPELRDIMQFMFEHAADSPQPMTCGQ